MGFSVLSCLSEPNTESELNHLVQPPHELISLIDSVSVNIITRSKKIDSFFYTTLHCPKDVVKDFIPFYAIGLFLYP